jgi:DNA-binding MarR family transcriptional regulator
MRGPEKVEPAEDFLALERQVCFALAVASRSVVSLYRPLLEPMGLTHPQYLVMLALWQHEPLSVTRIGQLLQLEPATLSPLLKRLEVAGLVIRRRDPQNERTLKVTLTPRGRQLREQALDIPPAVIERLGMSVDDLKSLHQTLTELIGQVNRPHAAADMADTEGAAPSTVG